MIGEICEAFHCTPSQAMQEDFALCQQIIVMRKYAELSALEDRDPKAISGEQRRFMDALEGRERER